MPAVRNQAGQTRAKQQRSPALKYISDPPSIPFLTRYSFGSKIANIFLGHSRRSLTVHEDLICQHSPYFRKKLQGNRKSIEGSCPICLDELLAVTEELTYCTTCGGNFHAECAEDWFNQSRGRPCPLCRGRWARRHSTQSVRIVGIQKVHFETYREWLYRGQVTYPEAVERDDFKPMIRIYLFALRIEDAKFSTAVLHAILERYEEKGTYPDQHAVALAYEEGASKDAAGLHRLQGFLVDTYIAVAHASWFEDEDWRAYPHEFLRDVAVAMFYKHPAKNKWNLDTWKAKVEAEETGILGETEGEDQPC